MTKRGHDCFSGGLFAALLLSLLLSLLASPSASAHAIGGKDAAFVAAARGIDFWPFFYLGAKHMVTGYDHLLFIAGVIFLLYRLRQVALYVTLFSLGHSLTLILGVLANWRVDAHLVDAVIGLSVMWKALDNLGAFRTLFGRQPDNRLMVAGFGLVHGLGLATRLQSLRLHPDGLVGNLLAFNLGVEAGQLLVLSLFLFVMAAWRGSHWFNRSAVAINLMILAAGTILMETQLAGYLLEGQR